MTHTLADWTIFLIAFAFVVVLCMFLEERAR